MLNQMNPMFKRKSMTSAPTSSPITPQQENPALGSMPQSDTNRSGLGTPNPNAVSPTFRGQASTEPQMQMNPAGQFLGKPINMNQLSERPTPGPGGTSNVINPVQRAAMMKRFNPLG